MRSILDNKFSNIIKSNQAFKLGKNPLVKLKVSIENEPNIKIEAAYIQKRLGDFQNNISISPGEVGWLETVNMLDESFLNWIKQWRFPNFNVIEEDNGISVEIEVAYADAIIAQKIIESCLSEARFTYLLETSKEPEGSFYAFGSDRYNIKTSGFLNSKSINIIEDAIGLQPNPDWYSLVAIFLNVSPFNFIGTTNPYHSITLAQPIITFCDDAKWLEGWPDSNFAPTEEQFDQSKFKGFVLDAADPALAVEMRTKHPKAILVSPETNSFEMAHTSSHVGNMIFMWSQQLVQDLNIAYYKPEISWSE